MPAEGHRGLGAFFGSRSEDKGGVLGAAASASFPPEKSSLPRAFHYTHQYRHNLGFDNCYITTYFRQIDARRGEQVGQGGRDSGQPCHPRWGVPEAALSHPLALIQNKQTLLPLLREETSSFIFPCNPAVQRPELQHMVRGWGSSGGVRAGDSTL